MPIGATKNTTTATVMRKDKAIAKPNARRAGNGLKAASKTMGTLARDGSCEKRRAEKLEWFGGSKTSQGASGDSPTYVFVRARVTAQ